MASTSANPASIRIIPYEVINETHSWGRYGDFKVIIDTTTCYVNATHFCEILQAGKPKIRGFGAWLKLESSSELLKYIATYIDKPVDKMMIMQSKLPGQLRGTYCHPDLIPHIACWANPKFAVELMNLPNDTLANLVARSKDDIIINLEARVAELLAEQSHIISARDEAIKNISNFRTDAVDAIKTVKDIHGSAVDAIKTVKDIHGDLVEVHKEARIFCADTRKVCTII